MEPSDTVQRPGVRLQTRALTKRFAGADGRSELALDRLDLVVDAGEFVAIIGPSGCGKSTFFHIAAGLEQPRRSRCCNSSGWATSPGHGRGSSRGGCVTGRPFCARL